MDSIAPDSPPPAETAAATAARSRILTFARVVSIAWHPMLLLTVLAIAVTRRRVPEGATLLAAILLIVGALPVLWFTEHKVRGGQWETRDASERRERPTLYLIALASIGGLLVYALAWGPRFLVPGLAAFAALLVVGLAAMRWMKLSLHLSTAAFVAVGLSADAPWPAAILFLSLPLVAWSRLVLGKHTLSEVILGGALGTAAGLAAVLATN